MKCHGIESTENHFCGNSILWKSIFCTIGTIELWIAAGLRDGAEIPVINEEEWSELD